MNSLLDAPFDYRVLEVLGSAPGLFFPPAEVLERLGGDSDDLRQALAALRRVGYSVEGHPDGGFRLCTEVEVIRRDMILGALKTEALGRTLACYLEVESTNDLAMQAALEGAPHGTVVTAEHQTAGRGRRGQTWFSPPGTGLWISCILRFDLSVCEAWMLTMGAVVAVADAVEEVAGLRADLKWPNDVLVDGRKLAGVLTETRVEGDALAFAVLGVGINVNQEGEDFPADLWETATSVKMATGQSQDRSVFLRAFLQGLEWVYADLDADRIRALWEARSRMGAVGWRP